LDAYVNRLTIRWLHFKQSILVQHSVQHICHESSDLNNKNTISISNRIESITRWVVQPVYVTTENITNKNFHASHCTSPAMHCGMPHAWVEGNPHLVQLSVMLHIWLENESMHYEMETKSHPYDISWLLKQAKWRFTHLPHLPSPTVTTPNIGKHKLEFVPLRLDFKMIHFQCLQLK